MYGLRRKKERKKERKEGRKKERKKIEKTVSKQIIGNGRKTVRKIKNGNIRRKILEKKYDSRVDKNWKRKCRERIIRGEEKNSAHPNG